MPNCSFIFSTTSSISFSDFFPKYLNFMSSFLEYETRSAKVSISAPFKQLKALTERPMSESLVRRRCLVLRLSSSSSLVSDSTAFSIEMFLSSVNSLK